MGVLPVLELPILVAYWTAPTGVITSAQFRQKTADIALPRIDWTCFYHETINPE